MSKTNKEWHTMGQWRENRVLYWLPRVLSLFFVIFLSLFALDVFNEYQGLAVIVPLLIHLSPSFILLLVVIPAWKYDLIGAVAFISFAFLYMYDVGFNRPWSWYAGIVVPSFSVGILYLLSWLNKSSKITRFETH